MKKIFCILFVLVFSFACLPQFSVLADGIIPRNNNVLSAKTEFAIVNNGIAVVSLYFEGYPSVTTGATISIKIEKRFLLAFWNEVISENVVISDYRYANEFAYQLDKTGTYRCTVEYTISGTGGADDVITFQEKATY